MIINLFIKLDIKIVHSMKCNNRQKLILLFNLCYLIIIMIAFFSSGIIKRKIDRIFSSSRYSSSHIKCTQLSSFIYIFILLILKNNLKSFIKGSCCKKLRSQYFFSIFFTNFNLLQKTFLRRKNLNKVLVQITRNLALILFSYRFIDNTIVYYY